MKPHIICHMITSLDGGLHPSRFTKSPDGERSEWSDAYETIHKSLKGDAWMVGRVTMAEISKAGAHPPQGPFEVDRSLNVANRDASSYAIALDRSGKVHFKSGDLDGDHVIVLLGKDIADSHLAELKADGVSYIVAKGDEMDLKAMMETLGREFGIKRLLLEGGGSINGSLFAAGLADELSLLVCPALDSRKGADRMVEFGEEGLAGKCELSLASCEQLDKGMLHLRYKVS
ncbi:RibD family protein [Neorhizobium alkalisoli]|uniref:Riboflavin biosynthesis pyrimidine reductase n=1 Tax=Neorhizobium alkalisoli TaxID=528178 RepID=A0A561R700_9HYPH|nr:RibD family protein [Neorhizobium alkalisoli]TWF58384.1 riboflavin biosynthesis pyrimidine reductase [Neorhizobium alkalisoli]